MLHLSSARVPHHSILILVRTPPHPTQVEHTTGNDWPFIAIHDDSSTSHPRRLWTVPFVSTRFDSFPARFDLPVGEGPRIRPVDGMRGVQRGLESGEWGRM